MSSNRPARQSGAVYAASSTSSNVDERPDDAPRDVPDEAIEMVSSEMDSITTAVSSLLERLDTANNKLAEATSVRMTEWEMGRLFVEAQEFTDTALNTLDEQTHQMLLEAEQEADQIIANARLEAERIVAEAKSSPALSSETVTYLRSTIEGFARVNQELLKELTFLNEMLEGRAEATTEASRIDSAGVPNWDPELHSR
jgi:dsDNA-specific endonuclease/ATPase MutS2